MNISQAFSLPLLNKELIEQAQSRRTYILRVIYALVFYAFALWKYSIAGHGGAAGFENLGRGRELFQLLFNIQALAIVLLLPAITCGVVTVEKEKDTLALLLLTKLNPWNIVFEKTLSRVFAMATYQLLSLPLFAIVYSIGGVEFSDLIYAIVNLMCLTMIVGSVSIVFSTWFRTTSEAFITTYLLIFLFGSIVLFRTQSPLNGGWPVLYPMGTQDSQAGLVVALSNSVATLLGAFILSAGPLIVASRLLIPRAFVPAWNVVLEAFQRADRFFHTLNEHTTGGIVLVPDRQTLPMFDPIAWRETRKKSLGTFRYQFRILMLLLAPLIVIIAAIMIGEWRGDFTSPFHGFQGFFWLISLICITIHSTGVMPAERIRQTLDVLLVSPLTPAEIVTQKLSGVRRLIKVLSIPFVVLTLFQAIWTGYVTNGVTHVRGANLVLELMITSLAVIIYMPLIMWIGFEFGLRLKTQMQAVLCTFLTIAATCVVPDIAMFVWSLLIRLAWSYMTYGSAESFSMNIQSNPMELQLLSPWKVLFDSNDLTADFVELDSSGTVMLSTSNFDIWLMLAIHFAIYGTLWWCLRRNAIQVFSKIVRRMEPKAKSSRQFVSPTRKL